MNISLQTLSDLTAFFFYASVKATLLVALVLLIQRLAGKHLSGGMRYLLWLSVVVSLVTPVGFDTTLPATLLPDLSVREPAVSYNEENAGLPAAESRAIRDFNVPVQPPISLPARNVAAEPIAMTDPPFAWLQVLPYVWLAGVLLVLGAIAASSYRFARLVRRATTAPATVQDFLNDCMRQTACSIRVRVAHSADVQVPMIAGLFRPVLLLPQDIENRVSRMQLRHVFIHELMHLQRGDILSNWIVALVQALHWFNPVIWFAFFCMRQDRELACDAATLQHLAPADRAAYGHTLLRLNDTLQQTAIPPLALGILDSSSHLQQRIRMLVQASRSRSLPSLAAALLFLPLTAVAFSQPAVREAEAVVAVEPIVAAVEAAAAIAEPVVVMTEPATAIVERTAAAPVSAATEPTPVGTPVLESLMAPAEPATAAAEQVESPVSAVADAAPLALAASPVTIPLFAVEAAAAATQLPAVEFDADLASAIQVWAEDIDTAKHEGIRFIEDVDSTATECAARGDGIFATLSKPCSKTRRTLHHGQLLYFGYQCYLLGAKHEELASRYREAEASQPELSSALRASEENLADFCSKDTYAQQYPAFAALLAEAESLKHFKPGERTLATNIARANRMLRKTAWANSDWYEIGQGVGGGIEGGSYAGAMGGMASSAPADASAAAPTPAPAP